MADLERYPIRPGDKAEECAGIVDELWERQWRACEEIEQTTGEVHRVASGFRDPARQWYFWNCYQCCCCNNCNLAARPGTSFHELGLAIDFTNPPRNIPASRDIFYKWGIVFPIWGAKPEPWHGQMTPDRSPLPDQPPTTPPAKGDDMSGLIDAHTCNGITVQARLFLDAVQVRWNDAGSILWPANAYANLYDLGNGAGVAVGRIPTWCNQITVAEVPDMAGPRFVVMVMDSNTGLAYAAYQKPGTTGPPTLWDCHATGGWYGA